ncbi:hypothetical protein [Nocardia sp. NPDC004722]
MDHGQPRQELQGDELGAPVCESVRANAGKTVTILAEDTIFRVLHDGVEIQTYVRTNNSRITHLRAGRRQQKSTDS